jgi:hypothetical protein
MYNYNTWYHVFFISKFSVFFIKIIIKYYLIVYREIPLLYIYMILFSTGNIISASPEIKVDQRNQSTGHVEQRESNLTSLNLMEKHTMLLSLPTLHN